MAYDLILKGGHIFDPGRGLNEVGDIGVTNGIIASVGGSLEADGDARRVMQLRDDQYVVPGLIDVHTHFMFGSQTPGVNWQASPPEIAGVLSGVTTILDAGTVGAWNFGIFPLYLEGRTKTRLTCFLNIGRVGILGLPRAQPDMYHPDEIDLDGTIKAAAEFPDTIKGIKLRLVGPVIREHGEELIARAKEAAEETNLPLMVHIGDTLTGDREKAPELTRKLLRTLRSGDIVTHVCTAHPGGVLDPENRVLTELRDAESTGVFFDSATGRNNFNYEVCQRLANQGFHPHTISTDMSTPGRREIVYSLTEFMSKFLAMGYSFEDVIRMTTTNAAQVLGTEDTLGALGTGREADITILERVTGKWEFEDCSGNLFYGDQAIVPVHTIRAGEMISPDWGPHPWGWLPKQDDR